MGRVFDWLDRRFGEPVRDYDMRINSLAAFHAGYAFFSLLNYEEEIDAFHVYNVWNGEFNSKLASPLPSGGFMLHCDRDMAERLNAGNAGYPVFVKLKAKRGRLYVMSFCVTYADAVMDMYFNGCEVITPEYVYFRKNELPGDAHFNEMQPAVCLAGGSRIAGSFALSVKFGGSYRMGSYRSGSYRTGSFRIGSFRMGSFGMGSFRTGSFSIGSFRMGSFGYGSFRSFAFGMGSFFGGSYRSGSFMLGSYRLGSYRQGSFAGRLFNGSYYSGSYHRGSFVYCGGDGVSRYEAGTAEVRGIADKGRNYTVRRLIEELGYGLDLI